MTFQFGRFSRLQFMLYSLGYMITLVSPAQTFQFSTMAQ